MICVQRGLRSQRSPRFAKQLLENANFAYMRTLLLFLLLWPLMIQAQTHDNWITPFATVEFEKERVIYRYMGNNPLCALEPQFLHPGLIRLAPESNPTNMGCKEIMEEMDLLHQYLLDPSHPANDRTDQLRYLKAFALQAVLALGRYELPSESLFEKVHQLTINPDQEMTDRAKLVAKLYQRIEETLKQKEANIVYINESASSGLFPAMFSSEAIVRSAVINDKVPPDSVVWPKYYGESGKYDFSEEIIEAYDNGFFICGNIHDYSNGTSMNGWLIKTDINGEILWEKIFDNSLHLSKFNALQSTIDGGLLICGTVRLVLDQTQPIVIKLNSCGEKEWCKIFSTSQNNPFSQDIKETDSGDIILLVNQFGEAPEETMHLFKLSSNGDVLWKKPFCNGFEHPDAAIPLGESVQITLSSKYLISGSAYWPDPWNPSGVKALRPTFTLVDSLGNEEWVLPFGLQDTLRGDAYNVIEKPINYFIGSCSYWKSQTEVHTLFVKFDIWGNELDHNIINSSSINPNFIEGHLPNNYFNDSILISGGIFEINPGEVYPIVELISDTNIFSENFVIYDSLIHTGLSSPFNHKLTFKNKFLSNSTFKESGNWDIVLSKLNLNLEYDTLDPGIYTYDSLCTTPGLPQSGFIFLDDCDIITGVDIPSPEEYYASLKIIPITAFPNPAKDKVTFTLGNTEHLPTLIPLNGEKPPHLKIFNILGLCVHTENIYRSQVECEVDVSRWPQGMYVAVVYSDGKPAGKCKFVVQ